MRLAPGAEGPADNRSYLLHQLIHGSQQVSSSSGGAPAIKHQPWIPLMAQISCHLIAGANTAINSDFYWRKPLGLMAAPGERE